MLVSIWLFNGHGGAWKATISYERLCEKQLFAGVGILLILGSFVYVFLRPGPNFHDFWCHGSRLESHWFSLGSKQVLVRNMLTRDCNKNTLFSTHIDIIYSTLFDNKMRQNCLLQSRAHASMQYKSALSSAAGIQKNRIRQTQQSPLNKRVPVHWWHRTLHVLLCRNMVFLVCSTMWNCQIGDSFVNLDPRKLVIEKPSSFSIKRSLSIVLFTFQSFFLCFNWEVVRARTYAQTIVADQHHQG